MSVHRKRGSALLIVLGFLSFMVVSAVAFAIYMRAERMPSSALRRAVATRHLVRAALAEAISRVDDAVRDDPFPGLCATNVNGIVADNRLFYYFRKPVKGSGGEQALDVWDGRVFMPPDAQGRTTDAATRYAPVSETVSVLTLEGLGYLPPGLVNDVRFLSRSSWAASWQPLPFDAGRFAYCAVNVSDYLDVNRVAASKPRTAEPQRRLSVAHLFDDKFDPRDARADNTYRGSSVGNPDTSAAQAFDDFTGKKDGNPFTGYAGGEGVDGLSGIGGTAPYVSMLDYNLALASSGPKSYFTPLFYNWLANKRQDKAYYIEASGLTSEMSKALRQPFVADSWSTNETWKVDISTVAGQPFTGALVSEKRGLTTYSQVAHAATPFMNAMDKSGALGVADYALLYDYLDHNDVPLSLALPCVERVPMIAGVTPPQFEPTQIQGVGDDETKTWTFNPNDWFKGQNELHFVIPFPFRHGLDRNAGSFKAQALVRLVYAPVGVDAVTLGKALLPDKAMWDDANMGQRMPDPTLLSFTLLSRKVDLTVPENVAKDDEAGVRGGSGGTGNLDFSFDDFNPRSYPRSVQVMQMTTEPDPDAKEGESKAVKFYTINASPLGTTGTEPALAVGRKYRDSEFDVAQEVKTKFVPYVFVWARILNADGLGTTVDLVPAGVQDDVILQGKSVVDYPEIQDLSGVEGDANRPVFAFRDANGDGSKAALSYFDIKAGTSSPGAVEWVPKGVYVTDPRFNYAPEFWYDATTGNITFSDWLSKTKTALAACGWCDQDIFMFTSNQGYLQSIGEFAFLPALHTRGDALSVTLSGPSVNQTGRGTFGTDAKTILTNYKYLWRTYDAQPFYEDAAKVGVGRDVQREFLVNPHTDNLGVMLAALANPPCDYWAAARGVDQAVSALHKELGNQSDTKIADFTAYKDYMFDKVNSDAYLEYKDILGLAKTFMAAMGGLELQPSDDVLKDLKDNLGFGGGKLTSVGTFDDRKLHNTISTMLKKLIRNSNGTIRPSSVWQVVWDSLWDTSGFDLEATDAGSFVDLLGVLLSQPLYTVDRKFLYSYWRDCFANNQQLFLIFVRAESNALGGPGEGTPAQQGGRAVALVWRDPDWSEGNGDNGRDRDWEVENSGNVNRQRPHRTRVLFYHQFD